MKECDCEKTMNRIQDIILEWESANITSRKALYEIKVIVNEEKLI